MKRFDKINGCCASKNKKNTQCSRQNVKPFPADENHTNYRYTAYFTNLDFTSKEI
jgi:hypothetical protein